MDTKKAATALAGTAIAGGIVGAALPGNEAVVSRTVIEESTDSEINEAFTRLKNLRKPIKRVEIEKGTNQIRFITTEAKKTEEIKTFEEINDQIEQLKNDNQKLENDITNFQDQISSNNDEITELESITSK